MAGQRFPVPRFEGVSQEQFIEHLYPQVRPSRGAESRDVGGYPFLPLERLRTGFLRSRLWGGGQLKVAGWPYGQGSTWGMLTVLSKFSASTVPRFWEAVGWQSVDYEKYFA